MYLLEMNLSERDYLVRLLKTQRSLAAKRMRMYLQDAVEVFSVTAWTNDDISDELTNQDVEDTVENIQAVRQAYQSRHLEEITVECGWAALEQAVFNLKLHRLAKKG